MGQPMDSDPESMEALASGADAMATDLEGVSAFDPAMFQAPMLAGLGPIGAPFIAAYLAATTNHVVNAQETSVGLHGFAESVREASARYQGVDDEEAAKLAMDADALDEAADQVEAGKEAALPAFLKDDLAPLDPGQTQFIRDIASTRDPAGHAGIKGADLGIPAKLADGTPVLLFGDCNKPGEHGKYNGGIVAATVANTPDGVQVTGVAGWGADKLLADHQLPDRHNYYPSGVIKLDGQQLLTVANVDVSKGFDPVSSHMVRIGDASGNWQSVSTDIKIEKDVPSYSYATGEQVGNTVYVAATENDNGPIGLYEIPVEHITDRSSWEQYRTGEVSGDAGGTPQMARVGDQWALSYMDQDALGNGVHVRLSDEPGGFAGAKAQFVDIAPTGDYPSPPGVGRAYGGYIQPDSIPDDLRFGISYFNEEGDPVNGEPYGVGEWRFRPN